MKNLVIALVGFFCLSSFSAFADQQQMKKVETAVQQQEENFPQSTWGKQPENVNKELVCKQHPDLCETKIEVNPTVEEN